MKPDVVIVGAGPVGLFTAIEMKLHNPNLKIKILDRNKEYSRHHILKLEKESLVNSKTYEKYDEVKALNGFVPTSDIESTFLKIAEDLGIEIKTGIKVDDCNVLFDHFPTAHTIIGADGAHSIVRRQLFDDKKIIDTNLQYIVEIKYKVEGETSTLPTLVYGPALGQVNHFVSENVGKPKNGSTPVSLFVFVDEQTYKEIRETPNARLTDLKPTTKVMKELLNTIQPWLSLRKVALNEGMEKGSEKINGVALSVYQSESFAKEINGKRAYVVGDAAAAVPYFRALNAGLISAAVTAKEIATKTQPDLAALNKNLADLAQGEINRAHKQNQKVNFGRILNYFLANASKITTGALLPSNMERAMLDARVSRPNFFRRNPRMLMTMGLFLVTAAVLLFTVAIPSSIVLGEAVLLSLAGAAAIVSTCVFLFKMGGYIASLFDKQDKPVKSLPAFPWENEHSEDNSFTLLTKLSCDPSSETIPVYSAEHEVLHYPSPLKSNVVNYDHKSAVIDEFSENSIQPS